MSKALCVVCPPKRAARSEPNRNLCFKHHGRLLGFLNDIQSAVLSIEKGSGGDGGPRPPGFRSNPTVRIDVVAALDYRTSPHEATYFDKDGIERPDGEVNSYARSILGSLVGLSTWIAEERGRSWPDIVTVDTECAFIRAHLDWCVARDDINEIYADLRELQGYVAGLRGDRKAKPIGKCPNLVDDVYCQAKLFAPLHGDTIRCNKCAREWPREEWLRLGRLLGDA